jgi:hypothetical protein
MARRDSVLRADVGVGKTPRWRVALGAGIAAVAIVLVALVVGLRHSSSNVSDVRPISATSSPGPLAPPAAAAVTTPAAALTPPAPAPSPPSPPLAETTAAREPSKRDAGGSSRRPKPAPVKASAPPPTAQSTRCDPNYYVDAHGDKHFKPECFTQKEAAR